jgi:aminopeptidase N
MKNLVIILFLFPFILLSQNDKSLINNKRSDTIDVKIYKLYLDVTDFTTNIIKASCQVNFESKMNNVSGISLDLLNLEIDSVIHHGQLANYTYNNVLLRVNFSTPLQQFEEDSVTIYYHGTPETDASGWGGFYFQNGIAYNLGVGFDAIPHNFGRVWHPCFDNFVERAQYEMTFRTIGTKRAYANGLIINEDTSTPGEMLRTWKINDAIPTYLACFSIGDYTHVTQTYQSPIYNTSTPVMLVARPQDTTGMKTSFTKLFDMLNIYEEKFGPYVWEKIGFVLVPFNSGAMEHATLVAYPQLVGAGNTTYDYLIAHELSHHWWGNLVTCKTSSDMWINEGFAVYSEAIYLENNNSYNHYINDLKSKHLTVLQRAHFNDGDFYPISGVPTGAVYGDHSYRKGAITLHNMRTYLGDSLFFAGIQSMQTDFAHTSVDAVDVKNKLSQTTGVDMTNFFEDWVFQPGFVGVVLDSFQVIPNGNLFDVKVSIRQKLRKADHIFSSFPLQITFVENVGNQSNQTILFTGEQMTAQFTLPFMPKMVYLNDNEGIMNAVTGNNYEINQNGTVLDSYSYSRVISPASNTAGSRLIRIEHCRVAPDAFHDNNPGVKISSERYWRVDGIWENDFLWNTWFIFDGRNNASGNLDADLMENPNNIAFIEDSMKLLYRPNPSSPWQILENAELNKQGSATDCSGRFILNNVQKGEYTFGYKFSSVGIKEDSNNNFVIFPNPTHGHFTFKAPIAGKAYEMRIFDISGNAIKQIQVVDGQTIALNPNWNGTIVIQLFLKNKLLGSQKLVVR